MTKKTQAITATIIVIVVLGFLGGLFIEQRLGGSMELAGLGELLKSQPIMPGMDLPELGEMPELEGLVAWINSPELTKEDFEGKVVLIDFWTYSCINCIRTFPFLKSWWEKYQDDDFILLGIHTPEFEFEKDLDNVQEAVDQFNLEYPIALDNDYRTWRNFHNRFWPAEYLFDKNGMLRYTHFGEGRYDETEQAIQRLLETDAEITDIDEFQHTRNRSPETYLGFNRIDRLVNINELNPGGESRFVDFELEIPVDNWVINGTWISNEEYLETTGAGRVTFNYTGSEVNLVAESSGETVQVIVTVDGEPVPEEIRGSDIKVGELGTTYIEISASNLYQLINGDSSKGKLLQLRIIDPGVKLYTLTFG